MVSLLSQMKTFPGCCAQLAIRHRVIPALELTCACARTILISYFQDFSDHAGARTMEKDEQVGCQKRRGDAP
jgi:hypothetical protein